MQELGGQRGEGAYFQKGTYFGENTVHVCVDICMGKIFKLQKEIMGIDPS